jgi:AcrR family transcriptional regulator
VKITKKGSKVAKLGVAALGNKAVATRESLKAAAIHLINLNGFSNVRVEDVTTEAGVAKGLFYRYFSSINDITRVVCEELFDSVLADADKRPFDAGMEPSYEWLYDYVLVTVDKFVQNRGLLACMFELHGSFPEISKAWQAAAHDWNLHLVAFVQRSSGMSPEEARDFCYILGAAMEGILYQATVRNTIDLRKIGQSAESITDTILQLWYRAIFLRSIS